MALLVCTLVMMAAAPVSMGEPEGDGVELLAAVGEAVVVVPVVGVVLEVVVVVTPGVPALV